MVTFELAIKTDMQNAAFQDGNDLTELARVLRDTADKIERGIDCSSIYDINGNNLGAYAFIG